MSTRLKRKLGDLGVDTSSARATENFCLIGTPLPPLEKSRDTGEFVPLWKQEVRDEKGRRRLHGAFTGGFSAGYFNTVGSKEGWAPTEFISSRSSRAKQKTARPEDFMDDEDLAERRDAQTLVDETEEMNVDLLGGTQAEIARRDAGGDDEQDSIAQALAAALLPAPQDSAGARILKRMGWRPGQGIGPRLTWQQKRAQDRELGIVEEEDGEEGDGEAGRHTYARRDTPIVRVVRKEDTHGLGYHPGLGLNDSLGVKGDQGPVGPQLAAGFGLGALNDADDDDVDVYDRAAGGRSRTRTAWDAADRDVDDDERIVIGQGGRGAKVRPAPAPSAASGGVFYDGTPVLPGFVLSDKPVSEDRWFPLPEVPKGWKPDPRRVWAKYNDNNKENASKKEETAQQKPIPHGKWRTGISADERGSILGETPLSSAPRSVFEYMSQKDRERLQNIAANQTQGAAHAPPEPFSVPRTEAHIAQTALRGFRPFPTDPAKQVRYTAYLYAQAQSSPEAGIERAEGQTLEEFAKELQDYAKAALFFKPMSSAMAGRFTTAAVVDHGPKVVEGLHTPAPAPPALEREEEREEEKREETPKAHAARMGMYGPMTREVQSWQPAKLLCKRFGVKDPNPEPEPAPAEAAASTSGWQPGAAAEEPLIAPDASFRTPAAPSRRKKEQRDLENIGLGEDEDQGRDTLTYQRPAMDIFKAIFASDDEGESGDEADADRGEEKTEEKVEDEKPVVHVSAEPPPGVPSRTAPPTFAEEKVDLNTFKPTFVPRSERSTKPKDRDKDKDKKDKKKKSKVLVSFEVDEEGGGGAPPRGKDRDKDRPKKKKRKEVKDEDEDMWVEKPPPEEAIKALAAARPAPSLPMDSDTKDEAGPAKARKRAIDFM